MIAQRVARALIVVCVTAGVAGCSAQSQQEDVAIKGAVAAYALDNAGVRKYFCEPDFNAGVTRPVKTKESDYRVVYDRESTLSNTGTKFDGTRVYKVNMHVTAENQPYLVRVLVWKAKMCVLDIAADPISE